MSAVAPYAPTPWVGATAPQSKIRVGGAPLFAPTLLVARTVPDGN